jgi:hypothetical protein
MPIRDDLDLHSIDLIEIRHNGKVIAEFYVEPEEQSKIVAEVQRLENVLNPPSVIQSDNVIYLRP